ncbi:MAG: Uma2 family endonuclease [Leptolyngbyaceae cyanobacterium CAN_BIN12]|nr:Uma2 family endonuclease [Leptolyngbyaceae cyanobacterium CAN_BIN12]
MADDIALLEEWYVPPPSLADLVFDDGVPLETNRHRIAMNALIRSTLQALSNRSDFFAGGNMFVYYSRVQRMNRDFRGPDFFVTLNVDGSKERQGWVVWEEEGRYPDVIVELLSPSTAAIDKGEKKDLYEQTFRTADYFIFDPFNPDSLCGWHLVNRRYQALQPNAQGCLWCESLGLWLGTWQGTIDREPPTGNCHWLRFYDPDSNLIPLPEEAAQKQAEVAQKQAEVAQKQAEAAQKQAEAAQKRADRLAERLRALGENPDEL